MKSIDTIQVNQRKTRENLVAGDLLDSITVDRAIAILVNNEVKPLIGNLFVLKLPLLGWQHFIGSRSADNWIPIGPTIAAHKFRRLIAVYDEALDFLVVPSVSANLIGVAEVRGDTAGVAIEFSTFV